MGRSIYLLPCRLQLILAYPTIRGKNLVFICEVVSTPALMFWWKNFLCLQSQQRNAISGLRAISWHQVIIFFILFFRPAYRNDPISRLQHL